jgi:hypothetical protein
MWSLMNTPSTAVVPLLYLLPQSGCVTFYGVTRITRRGAVDPSALREIAQRLVHSLALRADQLSDLLLREVMRDATRR